MKYVIALLAVAGLFVSVRALQVHYMDPSQAPPCAVTAKFDCGVVNHSRFSVFPPIVEDEAPGKLHIPVAVVGIVAYAVIGILALLGRMWIVLGLAEIGFICAAFLSYIEAYVIQMWCIYCLWSQCIIAAILLLSGLAVLLQWRRSRGSVRLDPRST